MPKAEIHILDAGHFALDTAAGQFGAERLNGSYSGTKAYLLNLSLSAVSRERKSL